MESKYLCKAKRKDNGEWIEGFYFCMVHDDGRHVHHFTIPLGIDLSLGTPIEKIQVEIDISTLCKQTGFIDDDKNAIWENDILHTFDMTEENYFVVWSNTKGAYVIADAVTGEVYDDELLSEILAETCLCPTVIGNIFDNPELMRVLS